MRISSQKGTFDRTFATLHSVFDIFALDTDVAKVSIDWLKIEVVY